MYGKTKLVPDLPPPTTPRLSFMGSGVDRGRTRSIQPKRGYGDDFFWGIIAFIFWVNGSGTDLCGQW